MKVLFLVIAVCCAIASSNGASIKPTSILTRKVPVQMRTVSIKGGAAERPSGGSATIATSTFNLAKSIIGAGVLALPSGVAALSDDPSALLPSAALCTIFGAVAAYSFSAIGKVCKDTNSKSFQEAWEKVVSPNSAWLISTTITALCLLTSLAYSIMIGDSFSELFKTFNFPELMSSRTNTILGLSALVLLPLCSLKSLNALAPFSLLGLGGTLYTAIVMAIRYLDGSYAPGGEFFNDIAIKPSFGARGPFNIFSMKSFVLLSMLSTAFVAHFNAPVFMNELKDPTVQRFNQVVNGGFGISLALFVFMMSVGFLTFGGASKGFILSNYSSKDILASAARFAVGLALITGYPFTFTALRNGLLDLAKLPQGSAARDRAFMPLTFAALSLLTVLAVLLKNVGFVVSITGAMFGCAVMFVIPAWLNLNHIKQKSSGSASSLEVTGNYAMLSTGVVMAFIGVAVTVMEEMGIKF